MDLLRSLACFMCPQPQGGLHEFAGEDDDKQLHATAGSLVCPSHRKQCLTPAPIATESYTDARELHPPMPSKPVRCISRDRILQPHHHRPSPSST